MSDKILKADPIFFRCRMSITWNVLASAGKSLECQRVNAIERSSICSAMENWDFISIDRDLEIVATYLFPTGSSQSYFNKDVPDYRRIMLGRHPSISS